MHYMSNHNEGPIIMVVQWARIKDFNGVRQVTNSYYATRVLMNIDIPLFKEFKDSLGPDDLMIPNSTSSKNATSLSGETVVHVNDLYEASDQTICSIIATVLKVDTDLGWFYEACKKCSSKVNPSGRGFHCDKCFQLYPSCQLKYSLLRVLNLCTSFINLIFSNMMIL